MFAINALICIIDRPRVCFKHDDDDDDNFFPLHYCGKGLFIRREKIKLTVRVVFVSYIGFAMQKCNFFRLLCALVVVLIKKCQFTNKNKFNNKYSLYGRTYVCEENKHESLLFTYNCLYLQNKNATRG